MPFLSWRKPIIALAVMLSTVFSFSQDKQNPKGNPPSEQPAKTAPQVKQVLPSYEGQNVSTVEIAGRPDVDMDALKRLVLQKEGQPFSQKDVDASIAALKATGKFEDVQVQVIPEIKGIRVMMVLQPGLYFGLFRFPGASRFSYSRLLQIANYPPEGPYSAVDVENSVQALEKFFQKSGYFQARVSPEVVPDRDNGLVNVLYYTSLGKKAKFGDIIIEGTTPEETARYKSKLKSITARLKGAAIRPGKTYSLKTVQNATLRLENTLLSEEHLAGKVQLIGANYDPATNRADVAFKMQVGPVIHAKIEGAHVWSWSKRKLLPLYQQVGTDPEIIQEGRQNLISHFQNKGYFNVNVTVDSQKQQDGSTNIVYHVTKNERHKVADVDLAGNTALDDETLKPHITVKQGGFLFNHGDYSDKLVRQSVKNLEAMYKAEGFSTVKVVPNVKNKEGNIDVTFNVTEGPRDVVESLVIQGNNTMPLAQLAPGGLKVVEGQPYSQKLVDEDRTKVVASYLNAGYLTSSFRATVRPVDNNPHRLAVTYQIYEGPKVITNSIVTIGKEKTQQAFVDKTIQLKLRTPLRTDEMLAAESRLYEPGIFDWAEIDPRRQITTQTNEDVVVKLHEAKRNSITYGFGFEVVNRGGSVPAGTVAVPGVPPIGVNKDVKTNEKTFYGPRGHFEYTRRNVRGKAETLTLAGLAGRLDQRFDITFQDPHFRYTNWASNLSLRGEYDATNPTFTSRLAEAGFQLQRALDKDKVKNFFLRYSYRQTGLTRLLIPELVPEQDRHLRLSTLSASFTRDTRDNLLDAHKGMYESVELGVTPTFFGSNVNFSRLLGQVAYYKDVHKGVIWANSLRLGFAKPFSGSHVPISEQFFSGGGATLRGFALNGAGPQRIIQICQDPADPATCSGTNVPTGGNQLMILNSEFRIPVTLKKGLGVVPFYDGGNVFRTIGFHGQYTNTFGIGLRYATPVGPVRIDVGHNMNVPPGVKATQYFITLGQAF